MKPFFSFASLPLLIGLTGVTALTGCAATSFSRIGHQYFTPRDANCDYTIYTTPPSDPFRVIGVLRFAKPLVSDSSTVEETKRIARHDVCKAGGTGLLLAPPNKDGGCDSGTVIWMGP